MVRAQVGQQKNRDERFFCEGGSGRMGEGGKLSRTRISPELTLSFVLAADRFQKVSRSHNRNLRVFIIFCVYGN